MSKTESTTNGTISTGAISGSQKVYVAGNLHAIRVAKNRVRVSVKAMNELKINGNHL